MSKYIITRELLMQRKFYLGRAKEIEQEMLNNEITDHLIWERNLFLNKAHECTVKLNNLNENKPILGDAPQAFAQILPILN